MRFEKPPVEVVRGRGEIGELVSQADCEQDRGPRADGDARITVLHATNRLAGGAGELGEHEHREPPAPARRVQVGAERDEGLMYGRREW